MNGAQVGFFILAGLLIVSSLWVVFQRNVVHSAMALVAALFLVAILFLTLNAPMVGVLQILVYAGAIMVLFLFVIMFLNPIGLEQRRRLWWGFGALAGLLLAGALVPVLTNGDAPRDPVVATELFGGPEELARSLFTDFVLPFEIASILLLVAIVGAVVLAKREP
ncbi:MAG: NADH-quinone oxidoreductase subunit J [Deltaproteobacteria bacterium]|nr:NADH-quinone oxidoreductase subunit J [Deltaproteobacteria bacterium]